MRKLQLRRLSFALFSLAALSSLFAYIVLPVEMQETCYMLAGLFVVMAVFSLF